MVIHPFHASFQPIFYLLKSSGVIGDGFFNWYALLDAFGADLCFHFQIRLTLDRARRSTLVGSNL